MLKLTEKDGAPIATFENDLGLYRFVRDQENSRMFENNPQFGRSPWGFSVYSLERVEFLLKNLKEPRDLSALKEAQAKQAGLIEISRGDINNLEEIVLTPDVDVDSFRKKWLLEYCAAYGLVLSGE